MKTCLLAGLLTLGLAGQAGAQAPVQTKDLDFAFLARNPACKPVVRWISETFSPNFRLPTGSSAAMLMFNLMEGRNRRMQPLITDDALRRLHPDGAELTTLEALEKMSDSVDACRKEMANEPIAGWLGTLAGGARDLAMLRQAERLFPEELAEATKGPGAGKFRSLTVKPRLTAPPPPKLTMAERLERRQRTETALNRSYLPEPFKGADQAEVMNGSPDRLGPEEVLRALVVEMQAGVAREHLTRRGYRLMHPVEGMIGVNQVKSVDGFSCDDPSSAGGVFCRMEITTYTSLVPTANRWGGPDSEGIARLFNADGVIERALSITGTFRYRDRGWRVAMAPEDRQRMISGEIRQGPHCPGIADSEVFFGCPPR